MSKEKEAVLYVLTLAAEWYSCKIKPKKMIANHRYDGVLYRNPEKANDPISLEKKVIFQNKLIELWYERYLKTKDHLQIPDVNVLFLTHTSVDTQGVPAADVLEAIKFAKISNYKQLPPTDMWIFLHMIILNNDYLYYNKDRYYAQWRRISKQFINFHKDKKGKYHAVIKLINNKIIIQQISSITFLEKMSPLI
jgi:hypothetical protein